MDFRVSRFKQHHRNNAVILYNELIICIRQIAFLYNWEGIDKNPIGNHFELSGIFLLLLYDILMEILLLTVFFAL